MGQAASRKAAGANDKLSMSGEAKKRMRRREVDVYNYYDDMGPGQGNCTWGAGILAHRGPCTKEESGKTVSQAEVDAEFSRRVAHAERIVRINVTTQSLNQDQFDALVSLTYNAGERGASGTFDLVDAGDMIPGYGRGADHGPGRAKMRELHMSFLRSTAHLRVLARATALIVITCAPSTAPAAEPAMDDLVGTWTLTKVLERAHAHLWAD